MNNLLSCVALICGSVLMVTGHAVAGFICWGIAWMTYEPYKG